jgi:hypothetical protein
MNHETCRSEMEDSIEESDSEQSVNKNSVSTQNRFDERHDSHKRQSVNQNRKRKKAVGKY